MPACDLEQLFGGLADQLPDSETASLVLSAATLPQMPPSVVTSQLVIRTGRTCVSLLHQRLCR